jgi:hypothetical protein
MKWVRIFWYIIFLFASIWVIRNLIMGRMEWWENLFPIVMLISTMPFRKWSDFNIFKKSK